jgi:hypothetical protein
MAGKEPGFDYYLGSSWGNAFLDCYGPDADHALCEASREEDRSVGRDADFFGLPLFACNGGSGYPTRESGKACFSEDMATNERDGCGMVASVGTCDRVCVAGFCGANDPPLESRGTTNVLSIYMREYKGEDDFRKPAQQQQQQQQQTSDATEALKIALPILVALVLAFVAFVAWKGWKVWRAEGAVLAQKDSSNTAAGDAPGDDTDGESAYEVQA